MHESQRLTKILPITKYVAESSKKVKVGLVQDGELHIWGRIRRYGIIPRQRECSRPVAPEEPIAAWEDIDLLSSEDFATWRIGH